MVRIILVTNMMGYVNQRMEGKRGKSHQQKNCRKLERSIFLKLNHFSSLYEEADYSLQHPLSIKKSWRA
jgi:hypothetical protein